MTDRSPGTAGFPGATRPIAEARSGPVTTYRSPSPESRALYWGARATLRQVYRAWPLTETGIRGLAAVERGFARLPQVPGVHVEPGELGGVPVTSMTPARAAGVELPPAGSPPAATAQSAAPLTDTSVLYLHGGAFIFCGPDTHRRVCASLATGLGVPVHAARYRKLPEVGVGTVVDDAYAAYRALSEQLPSGHRIVVAGDSAGGFLSAKLCELAALDGIRRPAAVVGYSPLLDLDGDIRDTHRIYRDAYQPASTVLRAQRLWAQDPDRLRGARSMLEVDPAAFPPTLITLAAGELVEPAALALTEHLHSAGGTVETHRWHTTVHAFPVLSGLFPESRQARDITLEFLRTQLN